jgi:hypothetical protein
LKIYFNNNNNNNNNNTLYLCSGVTEDESLGTPLNEGRARLS